MTKLETERRPSQGPPAGDQIDQHLRVGGRRELAAAMLGHESEHSRRLATEPAGAERVVCV